MLNFADAAAMRRSHADAQPIAAPAQAPFTAAIVTAGQVVQQRRDAEVVGRQPVVARAAAGDPLEVGARAERACPHR